MTPKLLEPPKAAMRKAIPPRLPAAQRHCHIDLRETVYQPPSSAPTHGGSSSSPADFRAPPCAGNSVPISSPTHPAPQRWRHRLTRVPSPTSTISPTLDPPNTAAHPFLCNPPPTPLSQPTSFKRIMRAKFPPKSPRDDLCIRPNGHRPQAPTQSSSSPASPFPHRRSHRKDAALLWHLLLIARKIDHDDGCRRGLPSSSKAPLRRKRPPSAMSSPGGRPLSGPPVNGQLSRPQGCAHRKVGGGAAHGTDSGSNKRTRQWRKRRSCKPHARDLILPLP